jgi:multiple sugar transport system permease protein
MSIAATPSAASGRIAGSAIALAGAGMAWFITSVGGPGGAGGPVGAQGAAALVLAVLLLVAGICTILSGSLRKGLSYTLLIVLAAFLMAPFVWMVLISLHPSKTPIPPLSEIIPRGPTGAFDPQWANYSFVLFNERLPVARFFVNSIVVASAVVLGQLLIASLAAYGFARIEFRGRETVFALFLGSMMFAGPVTQIPVYLIIKNLDWLDTYWALIVPGVGSAFSVFLLRQFFLQIPRELDEAARIDGAGDFRIYWRVILPLSRAALATAAAFTFFGVWTDFFSPLIYTNSTEMRTLEVGLSIFKNSYGGNNWPLQMTAAVIVMAPLLVVFLLTQRYFTKGIMLGSIK